jgi:hypothetical protein
MSVVRRYGNGRYRRVSPVVVAPHWPRPMNTGSILDLVAARPPVTTPDAAPASPPPPRPPRGTVLIG